MRALKTTLALGFGLAAGATAPLGCDDEGSGTTGRRVALEVRIAASADARSFTNREGWAVTIDEAAVATGALYFYDGEALFAARGGARGFVRVAHAHPGHYVAGNAKGQLLTPSSADLLAGGTLGTGDGVSGSFRSATFAFGAPPAGPLAGELGGSAIAVEGRAAKGGATKAFRFEAAADELRDPSGAPQVVGCPFDVADVQTDGVVTVTVRLPLWFEHVRFDDVPDSADGLPVKLTEGAARNQLVRGVKGALAYAFRFAPR